MSLTVASEPSTQLTGRWLALARAVWILAVALALGVYLFSIPLQFVYYQIVCSGAACPSDQISPAGLQQLQQAGLSLGYYAGYQTALNAILVLVFSIVGAIIFWRKSDDRMGLFASLTLVLVGSTFNSSAIVPVAQQYPALLFLNSFLSFLGTASLYVFFYLFPDGRFVPRWIRWLALLLFAYGALLAFRPDLAGIDLSLPIGMVSILFAQIYRYRRVSNTVQRQQTKWVVFGTAAGVAGILGLYLYTNIAEAGGNQLTIVSTLIDYTALDLFILLIPLSISMAILRSHLWDIDILIRRTLIYGLLTALLALVYFGSVVALQAIFTALTGQQRSELVTVISTLVIAALFVPLRRRVQAFIDRRFYRRKYDAARTLTKFSTTLRDEVNLDDLSAHLLDAVDDTMQPESVALWLQSEIGDPSQTPKTGRS